MQARARLPAGVALLLLFLWWRHQHAPDGSIAADNSVLSRSALERSAGLQPLQAAHTLQFELCNGFANQRIALMSGRLGCRAAL